jgi:hypothetical protein
LLVVLKKKKIRHRCISVVQELSVMRSKALVLAFASMLLSGAAVQAAPILDAGWEFDATLGASDVVLAAATDSVGSPYNYVLAAPAVFRITDQFVVGDIWSVFDFGALILTTSFVGFPAGFGDNAVADAGWTSPFFSSGEVLLAAGNHQLTVQGDGEGGLPARFFTRIDSVPEPTMGMLLVLGAVALAARRRRT